MISIIFINCCRVKEFLYFAAFLFLFLTTVVDHCPDAVLDGEPLVGVEPVAPRHTEGGAQ